MTKVLPVYSIIRLAQSNFEPQGTGGTDKINQFESINPDLDSNLDLIFYTWDLNNDTIISENKDTVIRTRTCNK